MFGIVVSYRLQLGMIEIRQYKTRTGEDVLGRWLSQLRDLHARARIAVRLDRLVLGNFGDVKSLGGGLHELRIDVGAGYRVYFAKFGAVCVLLLCGGDKSRQSADIERARSLLKDYKERSEEDES